MERRPLLRLTKPTGTKITHHPIAALLADAPGSGWWTLRFDGACAGNGRADATGRWAFLLIDPACRTAAIRAGTATGAPVTVNTAEWEGLVNGLRAAVGTVGTGLLMEGDSDLVISQLNERWTARDDALELLGQIGLPWFARWIPREENVFCNGLSQG